MEDVKSVLEEMGNFESKEELENFVKGFKKEELVEILMSVKGNLRRFNKGRKDEVLEILKGESSISVEDIGKRLGISGKNVSSQLTYLRKDGYKIGTRSNGKKYLEEMDN